MNSSKTFVEQITASGGGFTVPENHGIAYVVICTNHTATKAGVDTWQLEEGTTATAFIPYYISAFQASIVQSVGSNTDKIMSQKAVTDALQNLGRDKALALPMFSPKKIRFVMHRGFSYTTEQYTPENARPENTVAAFEQAGIAGAFGIETDIRETDGGDFFLMHDPTVDRTTDGTGYIKSMTSVQIEALTIDAGANVATYNNLKVPKLEEYLQVCAKYGCVPFMDIVGMQNGYEELISIVRQYGMEDNCVFICSQEGSFDAIRAITNKPTLFINARSTDDFDTVISTYKNQDNVIIGFQRQDTPTLTAQQVLECHEAGVVVNAWTFNYDQQLAGYAPLGIDLVTCEILPLR